MMSTTDSPTTLRVAGVRDITPTLSRSRAVSGVSPPPGALEGLNLKILEHLKEDGRATFSSIAEKLGVSESTVRSRVTRMREQNMIQFITVTNPLAMGQSCWAMLGITVQPGTNVATVAEYLSGLDEVVYAMRIAGRFDLLVEVVVDSPITLRDFLDEHCYQSPLVSSVEPMMGLDLYKSLFKWEIPLAGNVAK